MTEAGRVPGFDTVILAGGSALRMGGADKPGLVVGDQPLLVSVAAAAATAGTTRLVVVGPVRPGAVQVAIGALAAARPGWLAWVCEDPPGGGPVAGLRRGLAEVEAAWVVLLAADLPFLSAAELIALLRSAADVSAGPDISAGAVLVDGNGRPQWLISCWRASSLRPALAAYGGDSLHGLLAPLGAAHVRAAAPGAGRPPWLDCDTPDDLAAARRAALANGPERGGQP